MKQVVKRLEIVVMVASVLLLPAFAKALASEFTCESLEGGEFVGCLSLPPDAPLGSKAKANRLTPVPRANQASLLSRDDLSGGEVYSPALGEGFVRSSRGLVNPAMMAAVATEAQIRRVELFLKGGPAARGDLRVIATGLRETPKK